MRKLLLFTFWLAATAAWAKDYQVSSPDGLLTVTVHAGQDRLTWEVRHGSTTILTPSEIGINGTLAKLKGKTEGHTVTVRNQQYSVEFRADDELAGVVGHILSVAKYQPQTAYTYYFGSGWSRNPATGFHSLSDWEAYLARFAAQLRTPLQVKY